MLLKEAVAVYGENRTYHLIALREQNEAFNYVRISGTY
jgi:hypothetical protein